MSTTTSFLTAYQPHDETLAMSHHSIGGKSHMAVHESSSIKITKRERDVLYLIAYEFSSKEIAKKLYVSYETASSHRQNIIRKLKVKNTAEMIRVAYGQGLLPI